MKTIFVPHLGYKVMYGINKKEFTNGQSNSVAFTENTDKHTVKIFFKKKTISINSSIIAHEVMHAIQFICRNRNIAMERELEHMGYLMQYIHQSIMGNEYDV